MENKNLEGQMSLDSQLEGTAPEVQTKEFSIGKPAKEENIFFEVEKTKKEEKTEAEVINPVEEELIIGAVPTPPEKKEEPVLQGENTDEPKKKRQVYVPKFTEASEKYRRMIDTRTMSSQNNPRFAPVMKETEDELYELEGEGYFDPTAEINHVPKNQVFVNVTPSEPEPDSMNVYKFAEAPSTEAEPETVPEEPSEPTLEDELSAIEKLIAKEPVEEELSSEEQLPEEQTEEDAPKEEPTPAEDYQLPDPVNLVHIVDFSDTPSKEKTEPVPDCVSPDEPSSDKRSTAEFTHQTQRDSFKDRFLDSLMATKIRLGAIGIFSLVLLVFEWLASSGVISAAVFPESGFVGTLAAFDLLFVACIFLLAIPETVRAFKYLLRGKLLPEISLTAGLLAVVVYSTAVMLTPDTEYPLLGFIFAISALAAVFSTYYRTSGDFAAFKQVSKNEVKKVLDVKLTRELEDENAALDGLVDEYNSKTARIYRTAFVTDFFKRAGEPVVNNKRVAFMLAAPAATALISAVICFFIPGGVVAAFSAFALVFLLGCPAFALLSYKIPYLDTQSATLAEESAVIGEKSYMDFSEVDVIAFEDTEIFGTEDVKLKRFVLYGDSIERAMRQMYSLFSVIGGPLNQVFSKALDNRVRHTPAEDIEIESDGISGVLSGSRIFAGSDEYMRRHGIPLPASAPIGAGVDTTKILYYAEGGEIYAKFFVRYSFSEEFTSLLPEMKNAGIVPLIYTNDPNLQGELLKTLSAGSDCMRVVKKLTPRSDIGKTYRRASAGVVTYGDKINAINTILLARKYRGFSDSTAIAELYTVSIAAALGALISVLGIALPSVVYGALQALLCVALRLVSRKVFAEQKDSE